jgi:acetyltransferase AlgX (SGNH hydrolase-like protein)/tetratricopeptide repeat protein
MIATLADGQIEVEEGGNGWLFIRSAEGVDLLKAATNVATWAQSHLPVLTAQFAGRNARVASLGIPYIVAVAPEKTSIYPEYLPSRYRIERPTPGDLLTAACANAGMETVDLTSILIAAKGPLGVYHAEDSHWTYFGAYTAYRAMMEVVQKRMPIRIIDPIDVRYWDTEGFGDLGVHLTPERRGRLQNVKVAGSIETVLDTYDERELPIAIHRCERGRGKAVVLRDSFASSLAPFLSRTFAETIYIGRTLFDDLIEEMKPDIVLHEFAERALIAYPKGSTDLEPRSWRQYYMEAYEHPQHAHLILPLRLALRRGRFEDAVILARQLSEASSRKLDHNLAEAMIGSGAYGEAIEVCLRIETERGGNPFVSYLKAWAYRGSGRNDESISSMREALEARPRNACFLYFCGLWLLDSGDAATAVELLQAAVDRVPDLVHGWRGLSLAYSLLRADSAAVLARQEADRLESSQSCS